MSYDTLSGALAAKRYESARRIGIELIGNPTTCTVENLLLLHDAYVALADFHTAREVLETHQDKFQADPFLLTLKLAEDFQILAIEGHYRLSSEARQGFSIDEYVAKYRNLAAEKFGETEKLATSDAQKAEFEATLIRRKLKEKPATSKQSSNEKRADGNSIITGRIRLADGKPAAGATVTLGLKTEVTHADPGTHYTHEMHYVPVIGPLEKLVVTADHSGAFRFEQVPAGTQDYLAVTLDPEIWEIPTRFLARSIVTPANSTVDLGDLQIAEWQSAPTACIASPHPSSLDVEGARWAKLTEWNLHNPFYYAFRRQLVRFPLPASATSSRGLRVEVVPGVPELFQVSGDEIALMTDLAMRTDKTVALFTGIESAIPLATPLQLVEESASVWRIETGTAQFHIAGNANDPSLAPIQSVKGADGVWRGQGRFILPEEITLRDQSTRVLEQGPLFLKVLIEYSLSNGGGYSLELTAIAGEPYLLVNERSSEIDGAAFEFSLREFSGGRGFLHWNPEAGGRHWATLQAKAEVTARLPESIPWWIPPQGFGYAMTPEGLREKDYIAVFSIRRGEWIDRKFERIANGPIDRDGQENRELDWPYPEMVGSSISMITAHTDETGDAFFHFGMFDGERSWGLLASTLERNDGLYKDLASIQHANSSPRLQDFKDWHLDEPDEITRPFVVLQRDKLPALRQKASHPRFKKLWKKILSGKVPGPSQGLAFAIEGDPAIAWKKRIDLLAIAEIRAKMTLLGRDWSDIYSPVGGRPITQWAEEYDLIAASGVFSPEEERDLRAFFVLMGHMFMEPDFMNWKFNGRNANFEADRVDIVAAIGLVFDGHPDAAKFLDHAIERTHKSLTVYCTPGSGKWYENPSCYYLHATKCRMNLVFHLANHGRLDVTKIPRLKDLLRWAVVLLTPAQPVSYAIMRDGGEEAYLNTEKVRKVPPIGDHASIGRWLPEHYFFIGKLFLKDDPELGRELMSAYFLSSGDGARLLDNKAHPVEQEGEQLFHDVALGSSFGNLPLLFTSIEENDIPASAHIEPVSRRLEGFGAVFRNRVNTPEEDYVLIKQGPGGYRFHRTEGSFILFSEGRPLVYDGGEAGETWRHSTLSFFDVRMPMSAGHVERFFTTPQFQFTQGVHPEIIEPGKPVFLSDSCEHELVEECYRRFEKANPAVVRSFAYVGSDYLVVHDALDIDPSVPSHWHLQVVGEGGSGREGTYDFKGRFGVDLQVILPGQTFADEKIETVPILEYHGKPEEWFTMQHLQLSVPKAKNYLAVVRPLAKNAARLSAESLTHGDNLIGTHVTGGGFSDYHWFDRNGTEYQTEGLSFRGKYGAALFREGQTTLWLGASGEIQTADFLLRSESSAALLESSTAGITLHAQGAGIIQVQFQGTTREFVSEGNQTWSLS